MLVTYDTAADHLRLGDLKTDPETETSVTRYLVQAEQLVITHVKRFDHTWTDTTDPATDREFAIVQAGILTVLGNLWRFRGDDETSAAGNGPLTPRVAELLSQLRDPSFA